MRDLHSITPSSSVGNTCLMTAPSSVSRQNTFPQAMNSADIFLIFLEKCWNLNYLLYICTYLQTKVINMDKNTSLRARVLAMEVGEEITIPVSEYGYTTIRGYASDLGFAANRKYSTRRDRESRTYTIIRMA